MFSGRSEKRGGGHVKSETIATDLKTFTSEWFTPVNQSVSLGGGGELNESGGGGLRRWRIIFWAVFQQELRSYSLCCSSLWGWSFSLLWFIYCEWAWLFYSHFSPRYFITVVSFYKANTESLRLWWKQWSVFKPSHLTSTGFSCLFCLLQLRHSFSIKHLFLNLNYTLQLFKDIFCFD